MKLGKQEKNIKWKKDVQTEEELKKRIKNKIEFKAPGYYVSKYGEIECDSTIE